MVRYLLSAVLVFCFCVQNVVAQKVLKTKIKKKERCYTAIYMKKAMEKNSKIMSTPQFENWMRTKIEDRRKQVGTLGVENGINNTIVNYTLPIVFHIIHSGETVGNGTNIAQNKIYAQVAQLNRDFANLSGSNYAVASHTGIKFGLATQTPSGSAMPEPGIDRVDYRTKGFTAPPYDPTTDYVWEVIKAETIWDPNRYVNIWVMDASESGILGIATFPSASTLDGLDETETNTDAGVIVDAATIGSSFTSADCADQNPYELGRTLSHELGHFFGLRHIWGDDNCGDDFCGDTPTHEADNSGRPAHPKPNSCGTADEMFENYMDYTDDRMVHTFTFNQVERMQTVMANSLRRKSLATSNVPVVMPNFSNKIAFANCSGAEFFTETGKTGVSVRYNDIKIPVSVEGAATGNATVTINTSGTAVNGVDYQLLTPSLSFTSGDFAKNIEIRIIDNAKVDPTRTITITYTINGAGVSAAAAAQTVTLYLFDDDDIIVGQNTVNLFSESFSGGTLPAGWATYDDATNVFTVSSNGNAGGSGAAAHVTNNATTKPNTYANSVGYAILETPLIDASRVAALNELSFKYRIRGRSYNFNSVSNATSGHYGLMTMSLANDPNGNLGLFGFTSGDKGYGPYGNTSAVVANTVAINAAPYNGSKFYLDFYFEVAASGTVNNPGLNVDDIVLTATPFAIETAVSSSYAFNIQSGTGTYHFKSTNNKALGMLKDANAALSNVTMSIVEAGVDRLNISTGSTNYLRSRKAVKVVPSVANNTTQYSLTLYLTTQEAAAWGTSATTAKVMRVNDGVALSANLNTTNARVFNATVSDKRTTDGYIAYTIPAVGFGTFVLVDQTTVLPLNWVSFEGKIQNNQTYLNWETSAEINTYGFDVERSINGTQFQKIGWVKANGAAKNQYQFIDAAVQKGGKYYYRLKQTDNDGIFSYSNTVLVTYTDVAKQVMITPNPFINKLNIQFNGNFTGKADVTITDAIGKTVYRSAVMSSNVLSVNTQHWNKGVYFVRLEAADKQEIIKVIKD